MAAPTKATLKLSPFTINIPEETLQEFKTLLKLSKLPPPTYEGTKEKFGVTREWMAHAKEEWEKFDWRASEKSLNNIPGAQHYTTQVGEWTLHFVAHFSGNASATPLLLPHGWPGDFTEYLPLLQTLQDLHPGKFDIIIPSLPGYCFSSRPPLDRDTTLQDIADPLHQLMLGLGYKSYIVTGGDIGSFIAQILSAHKECRGILLNLFSPAQFVPPGPGTSELELEAAKRRQEFNTVGNAYMLMHATRPSTISHCLAASPLSLLAWIGEKIRDWTDETPALKDFLERLTLWWLTETFPTSIYPYRAIVAGLKEGKGPDEPAEGGGPRGRWGYAWYPKELFPLTRGELEAEKKGNGMGGRLVWTGWHEEGGHWPGFEVPEMLAGDIVNFLEALEKDEKENP